MKKIPIKGILWTRVCAALFAALMSVVCFFLPFTTLKATSQAKEPFDEYLHHAYSAGAIDLAEWHEYQALLTPKTIEEEETSQIEATVSVADLLFHSVDVAVILIRLNQLQSIGEDGDLAGKFTELNPTSLQIAYYCASFIYTTEDTFVGGSTELDEAAGLTQLKYTNDDLTKSFTFVWTLLFLLAVLILYVIALVNAGILLVDTLIHLKKTELPFQKIRKRTSTLLTPWLSAVLLAAVTANGNLAVGSILTLVCALLTLSVNVVASYLQENTRAQRNYLLITHFIALLSIVGLLVAFSCYTSAGLCKWLMTPDSDLLIHQVILNKNLTHVEDINYFYGLYTYVALMLNFIGTLFSILLFSCLVCVLLDGAILLKRKPSKKRNPILQAVFCLLVIPLPLILTKTIIQIPLPSGMTSTTVWAWLGALLFLLAQIPRRGLYKRFAKLSEEEKAQLFCSFSNKERTTKDQEGAVMNTLSSSLEESPDE